MWTGKTWQALVAATLRTHPCEARHLRVDTQAVLAVCVHQEATKEQMAINNFHIRAAFKDGIIRNRTDDSILFNILNFQRAHNR